MFFLPLIGGRKIKNVTKSGFPEWNSSFSWSFFQQSPTHRYRLSTEPAKVSNSFRENMVAVSAEFKGMFHPAGILPDQPSLRFLWREIPTSDVVVF